MNGSGIKNAYSRCVGSVSTMRFFLGWYRKRYCKGQKTLCFLAFCIKCKGRHPKMPTPHRKEWSPAITVVWLGFHKFDPLFKIVYKVLIIKVFRPILIAPSKQGRSTYQIIDVVH